MRFCPKTISIASANVFASKLMNWPALMVSTPGQLSSQDKNCASQAMPAWN